MLNLFDETKIRVKPTLVKYISDLFSRINKTFVFDPYTQYKKPPRPARLQTGAVNFIPPISGGEPGARSGAIGRELKTTTVPDAYICIWFLIPDF